MAFQEIDPGPAPELGNFFKFNAIGDRLAGWFVSFAERQADFSDGPKKVKEWSFKNKEGVHTVTANFDLHRRLEKAGLKVGHKVIIQYVADIANQDPQKSAMKQFKVLVDYDAAPAAAARPPPPPPPPPPADEFGGGDDIPF